MRLTRETLIKIARETASQRARVSRRILCIYLTGSVLDDAPLLGGTTDIDLVIIEDGDPILPREIVRLSDEIHLDIAHYDQALFHQPRHLRTDPWLGPFIYRKPMVLFETHHWFDFIQAATGAQFFQPDYVLQRATALSQRARQGWMDLEMQPPEDHSLRISAYLKALENAGNALACLTGEGEPLAERRFMLKLPHRLQALNEPHLISDLIELMSPDLSLLEGNWPNWILAWKGAYQAASRGKDFPAQLHPCRQLYYERALAALWEESPGAALWLLLRTWALAAGHQPAEPHSSENAPAGSSPLAEWQAACHVLRLDEEHFHARLHALDGYLDRIEESLDAWGRANGVSDLIETG